MVVKLDVQKTRASLFWTNRYLLDYATIGEVPLSEVTEVVNAEKVLHGTDVSFVSARLSDLTPGTDVFIIIPLTGTGGTNAGGSPIPAFNTLRVDFQAGIGRPLRKYYRVFAGEAQTAGLNWDTVYLGDAQTVMTGLVSSTPAICGPEGNRITAASVKNLIQMRQVRRGSKRREEPVIPIA